MAQPEADYEIDLDEADRAYLAGHQARIAAERAEAERLAEADRRAALDPADQDDQDLAVIQAGAAQDAGAEIAEGTVTGRRTITFMGRKFRVADKIGAMPLLKFASASDVSTSDPRALGAVYAILRDCIYSADWNDFEMHAIDTKADAEQLLDVVTSAMEVISGRPPGLPAGSSAGQRGRRGGSTGSRSGARGRVSKR